MSILIKKEHYNSVNEIFKDDELIINHLIELNKMKFMNLTGYKNLHFLWILVEQNSQFSDSVR
jgi:hypothetical protein